MSTASPGAPRTTPARCRVIVVGCGLIGRRRAEAVRANPHAELVATVDPGVDGLADSSAPHYHEVALVPVDSYEAAIIAVPHDVASGLAAGILRAGKPVLIEKPLGMTGSDARALEDLAAAAPLPSFVGYNYRFLPAISRLVTAIQAGDLGTLRNVDLLVGHGGHPGSAEGWKLDPVRAGGGVLLDPGVHLLDLLLQMAPATTCTSIEATRGFWGTGIEEDVVATFRNGELIATVRASHIRWVNTFRVEAYGDDGYALAEGRGGNYGPMTLRRGRRWAWRDPGVASQRDSEEVSEFGSVDASLADELSAVVEHWRSAGTPDDGLETGRPRPASMAEGRTVTELCETLYPRIGGSGALPEPRLREGGARPRWAPSRRI
jgi:1,5-anhydro-D-fructose reductase (1,5-anhydro-D-mannitol-forming)